MWEGLETIPELVAAPADWRRSVGSNFDGFKTQFLRKRSERSASIFCPRGCGCAHEVVERADGSLVGICCCEPWNCEDIPLTADEVILWELNVAKLGRAICNAYDGAPRETDLGIHGATQIGSFGNGVLPMVLMIQPDGESYTNAVAQLVARLPEHFILLAPTRRLVNGNALGWLKTARAGFFDLESTLVLLPSGKLQASKSGGELFSPHLPKASEPIDENRARQLFATIEKLESDGRLKNPSVMEVFRLYCIMCKTADEIVAMCKRTNRKISKGTVINRLEVIRRATGKNPKDLQAYSPHLERIEESIADSRAEHIHRKALAHDAGGQEDEQK